MSLNAATIEILIAKGLSASDILDVARASECKADRTNADRQARHRARKSNAVTVTPASPNDIYSNPENPSEAKASPSPTVETRLVEEWNAGPAANGARKAAKLDSSRKTLLRSRLKDHSEDEVFTALRNLGKSKFHCGDNDRGWRANLGWFLEAKNFLKALEMTPAATPASSGPKLSAEEQRAYVEQVARKFGRMAPEAPAERVGKPITFATVAGRTAGQPNGIP